MDHFHYKNDKLFAEEVDVSLMAKQISTPFYCYSAATLERHYKVFSEGFSDNDALVCFAVKANSNISVLRVLANLGAGGDCVSKGEIYRCLKAGIPANKIVFSGVGKSKEEMVYALNENIFQFNVESEQELEILNDIACSLGKKARIAFRVNPEVDANTHDKIATGRKEDKFGIPWDRVVSIYQHALSLKYIEIQGIATHIGSQLTSLEPMQKAFEKVVGMTEQLIKIGVKIKTLDLGGGLGIPYNDENPPLPRDYANMVKDVTKNLNCKLIFEPGRLIAGNAGILVAKTILLKDSGHRKFLVIDAAMNDLIRPAMYNAYHEILPVINNDAMLYNMDVVGPICETGDVFGKDYRLPILKPNDLVAIRSCGAYGAVMSSYYNSRSMIAEVLVSGDSYKLIRKTENIEDFISRSEIF
jgi:diaminopimelate decarboxylase